LRARIVLRSSDGMSNTAIAHELGITKHTSASGASASPGYGATVCWTNPGLARRVGLVTRRSRP